MGGGQAFTWTHSPHMLKKVEKLPHRLFFVCVFLSFFFVFMNWLVGRIQLSHPDAGPSPPMAYTNENVITKHVPKLPKMSRKNSFVSTTIKF